MSYQDRWLKQSRHQAAHRRIGNLRFKLFLMTYDLTAGSGSVTVPVSATPGHLRGAYVVHLLPSRQVAVATLPYDST